MADQLQKDREWKRQQAFQCQQILKALIELYAGAYFVALQKSAQSDVFLAPTMEASNARVYMEAFLPPLPSLRIAILDH